MTQDGEPFTQDELDEMLEIAIDPHTQTVPYEYYINQLMVSHVKKIVAFLSFHYQLNNALSNSMNLKAKRIYIN